MAMAAPGLSKARFRRLVPAGKDARLKDQKKQGVEESPLFSESSRSTGPKARRGRQAGAKTRLFLSFFICFHLMAVLFVPNSDNELGGRYLKVFLPYLNFLELTNCWNFFSPVPGAPVFMQFETVSSDGTPLEAGSWPERGASLFLTERSTRRIASADFMAVNDLRAEKMLVPYLCARTPGVRSVRLWRTRLSLPSIGEVEAGRRTLVDEVGADRHFVSHTFCDKEPK